MASIATTTTTTPVTNLKVTFIGDSLVQRPIRDMELYSKINSFLKKHNIENTHFEHFGSNGQNIQAIRDTQLPLALDTSPHIIILFWDSDCSDINENELSSADVTALRKKYIENVEYVVETVLKAKIHLIIGGPGVLGEHTFGKPPRFRYKNKMLNEYRVMNENVAKKYNIPYVDIRKAFQKAVPPYWMYYKGYHTKDGEHQNERGTMICAQMFSEAIRLHLLRKK